MAPEIKTTSVPRGVKLKAGELTGELFDASETVGEVEVAVGQKEPPFAGIMAEQEDKLLDAPVVKFTTPAPKRARVALLSVVEFAKGKPRGSYRIVEASPSETVIALGAQRLTVTRAGNQLTIRKEKAAP